MVAQPEIVPPAAAPEAPKKLPPGGGFLLGHDAGPIFTAEHFTDEQLELYRTATAFIDKEVTPLHKDIEAKKPGVMRELLRRAGELAAAYVDGIRHDHAEREAARALVLAALADAERAGSNLLVLPEYVRWKPAYYEAGGASHPTEFVLHPGLEGGWRALAIPPGETSFAQKVPFPEAWAGLTDGELEAVVGVKGARFCHKNLFIAVFDGWPSMIASLREGGLIRGPEPRPPASGADPKGIA